MYSINKNYFPFQQVEEDVEVLPTHYIVKTEQPLIKLEADGQEGEMSEDMFVQRRKVQILQSGSDQPRQRNKRKLSDLIAAEDENEKMFFNLQKQIKKTMQLRNDLVEQQLENSKFVLKQKKTIKTRIRNK